MNRFEQGETRNVSEGMWHERMRSLLPDYAMVRLRGATPDARWRELEVHLSGCDECSTELDDLCQLLNDSASGRLPTLSTYSKPDLWFLDRDAHDAVASSAEWQGRLDRTPADSNRPGVVETLIIQFTETLVSAFRQPQLAGAFRQTFYGSYQHPRSDPSALSVTIDISNPETGDLLCDVLVTVVDPHNPFEQEGHGVKLRYGAVTHEEITDHRGCVRFDRVPLGVIPQLQFIVQRRATE